MEHRRLYVVDNSSEEQSVKQYLCEWCSVSKQMDIATGYLEIGGLLDLDQSWQKLDKIRIILGNEVTKRTQEVIDAAVQALLSHLKDSVDDEQEHNEFLIGVPAIVDAMKSRKIECRVYDKDKFHAKAYITYFRDDYRDQFIPSMNLPNGYALVGSSNFTHAGLTKNIELNVQVDNEVAELQEWFEERWQEGTDITEAILKVIESSCKEYSPYDVYLRSMYEYFKSREETVSEWENHESVIYQGLSQYQRDGYNSMVEIADRYSGAFLCDGVGLGKTYVGMMLIERFVKKERKNVAYLSPDAQGIVSRDNLQQIITNETRLTSVMFSNNEIGTIEPIKELCTIAHEHGSLFHTDAVQAVGHVPINVNVLGVDFLSASAHKFNGPKGIGFLYIRKGTSITSFNDGGAQEHGYRAGTENVAGIVGMAQALKDNCAQMDTFHRKMSELEEALIRTLDESGLDYIRNGAKNHVPGNISLSFKDSDGEMLLHRLDLMGIAISTGSACDSENTQISHVIQAIKVPKEYAQGTVRVSFGKYNTEEDAKIIGHAFAKVLE